MKTVPCVWVIEKFNGKRWVPVVEKGLGTIASRTRSALPNRLRGERIRKYIRSGE